MSDGVCTVTWTGDHGGTYFVPCDQVQYITKDLVNSSSSTIPLYKSLDSGSSYSSDLSIPPLSHPRYYTGTSYYYVTNSSNVIFNPLGNVYAERNILLLGLVFFLCFYMMVRLFKRRI